MKMEQIRYEIGNTTVLLPFVFSYNFLAHVALNYDAVWLGVTFRGDRCGERFMVG